VDLTDHPWGGPWVWRVRRDPGPPVAPSSPTPLPTPDPEPDTLRAEVASLRTLVHHLVDAVMDRKIEAQDALNRANAALGKANVLESQMVQRGHPVEVTGSVGITDALYGRKVTWTGTVK
jgi:hypothetical protein